MAKVQFPTKVKYHQEVHAARTPFVVEDSEVPQLVKQGAVIIEPPKVEEPVEKLVEDNEPTFEESLSSMTIAELREYADNHSIKLGKATKKSDIISSIVNAVEDDE